MITSGGNRKPVNPDCGGRTRPGRRCILPPCPSTSSVNATDPYQLLSEIPEINSVEVFVRRWLGPLIDYDTDKDARLVDTLSWYLECGGNYDSTAKKLSLHRSTLRYRLQRIRDISARNLNDPNTRFNLQLATRAWTTVHALRQQL